VCAVDRLGVAGALRLDVTAPAAVADKAKIATPPNVVGRLHQRRFEVERLAPMTECSQ
jgi:hypothetical protein